jgi:drug/metabolite transporter (DMT)-like permease
VILSRFLLLAAVIIWGWTFVATKVGLRYLDALELLGLRFAIALPVLLLLIASRRTPLRLREHARSLSIASTIFLVHFVIQVSGLKHTSATNTGWIIAVTPLIIVVLARLFLSERIGRRALAGIGFATAGILLLVANGNPESLGWLASRGDWLVLASAFTWGLYTIATRDVSRALDPLAVTFAVLFPVTVVLVGVSLVRSGASSWRRLPVDGWLALLFLGVLGTAFAHWFWQIGVSRIGAGRAGTFLFLEPVSTTALAVPYLGEGLTPWTLIGGVMVLIGVWWGQRRGRSGPKDFRGPPRKETALPG